MAVEIKWTIYALEDIENIAEFIARDSEHFASIQVEKFFLRTEILESYPLAGRIRELIEGNYRIIYRVVSENQLDILIIHQSQRLLSNNPLFKK